MKVTNRLLNQKLDLCSLVWRHYTADSCIRQFSPSMHTFNRPYWYGRSGVGPECIMSPLYEFQNIHLRLNPTASIFFYILHQSAGFDSTHLQRLLSRAAWLLLQLARLQRLDVLVALPVAVIQQVLFGLEQPLARCHVTDADGEASVGCRR